MSAEQSSPAVKGPTASRDTEVELFSLAGNDGYLREVNEAFATLLGRRPDEVNGHSLLEFVHPDDLAQIVAGIAALERGEAEVLMENRFLQADGRAVHLQWVARPVPGTDTWWAAGRNTTEFHLLLAQRLDLRATLDLALGQTIAALWDLDAKTGVFTWEPQAAELLGVATDALPVTAQDLAATVNPDDVAELLAAVKTLTVSGAAEVGVRVGQDAGLRYLSLRGKVLTRDRRGRPLRAVGLVLDITAEKAMEEQMLRMVMSDALTGVPNRRAFDQAMRTEWRRCTRALEPLSVLMIDIDNFKRFNDSFGHPVGDAALIAVGRALSGSLHRAGDVLARYGGEEFAVVMPGVDAVGAITVANRLVQAVRAVTVRQAVGWNASVSIGAATWLPGSELTKSSELISRADAALYAAKAAGKDRAHPPLNTSGSDSDLPSQNGVSPASVGPG
ncbi:MAG: sensor domain-containing diguanylate cyclase [Nakamurella sp.]